MREIFSILFIVAVINEPRSLSVYHLQIAFDILQCLPACSAVNYRPDLLIKNGSLRA